MTLDQGPQKTFRVSVATDATIEDLADWIRAAICDTDDLIEFVKELDESAADMKFTVGVRDAMETAIQAEEEQ